VKNELKVEKLTQSLKETGSYGFLFLKNRFTLLKSNANRNEGFKVVVLIKTVLILF